MLPIDNIEPYEQSEKKELKAKIESNITNTWSIYRQARHMRPTPDELANQFEQIRLINRRDSCFLAFLYLTGCRCQEICRYHNKLTGKRLPAIQIMNIKELTVNGQSYWQIKNRVLKLKDGKMETVVEDKIIPYTPGDEPTWRMIKLIEEYCERNKLQATDELFPFSYSVGRKICIRRTKFGPHCFRMWRSKSLIEDYGLSPQDLQKWMGWKSPDMAMLYSKGSMQSIAHRFEKNVIFLNPIDTIL